MKALVWLKESQIIQVIAVVSAGWLMDLFTHICSYFIIRLSFSNADSMVDTRAGFTGELTPYTEQYSTDFFKRRNDIK